MTKLYAINTCFGGFSLSDEAHQWLIDNKGWKVADHIDANKLYHKDCLKLIEEGYSFYIMPESKKGRFMTKRSLLLDTSSLSFRSNPDLIECIKTLGPKASGRYAKIVLIECDYVSEDLQIADYNGMEELQTVPVTFNCKFDAAAESSHDA